jgi:hypothetical protein
VILSFHDKFSVKFTNRGDFKGKKKEREKEKIKNAGLIEIKASITI